MGLPLLLGGHHGPGRSEHVDGQQNPAHECQPQPDRDVCFYNSHQEYSDCKGALGLLAITEVGLVMHDGAALCQIPGGAALRAARVAEVGRRLRVHAVCEEDRERGVEEEAGERGKEAGDKENGLDEEEEEGEYADDDVVACHAVEGKEGQVSA